MEDAHDERDLDPYGAFPDMVNRIAGLPGKTPSHEPGYAFHTLYVPVSAGLRTFIVRFHNLRATGGTLNMRVHMVPADGSARAKLVDSARIPLEQLAEEGITRISFNGYPGMHFALYGTIVGNADVSADVCRITVDGGDPPATKATRADIAVAAPKLHGVVGLSSVEPATLRQCTSQAWTSEPPTEAYLEWASALDLKQPLTLENWPVLYPLLALDQFGFITESKSLLWIGHAPVGLSSAVAARGATMHHMNREDEAVALSESSGLPLFDSLCSVDYLTKSADERAVFSRITSLLAHLKPGGIAVYIVSASQTNAPEGAQEGFHAGDFERWALNMVAHSHQVAQLKLSSLKGDKTTVPFAFIVRK
ncbi:hypothetical protein FHS31_003094 [Sphingomonas vulcanisoli]|uniref:Class I SAM-dependent methyltransferase n=1 Tax=Sphingomonas vulcanisoli TaxID=1658060 RepID=A0ABX0TYA3_9SPHN|nr:hypothetical protein [Sphingomonas vulcanisoli]NIJ09462.1 hypothetical protein [Sphingomonas vulcanisoli]